MKSVMNLTLMLVFLSTTDPVFANEDLSSATQIYTINDEASDVRFLVYRSGLLAMLGHNHVVRAHGISGEIEARPEDFNTSGFQLNIPVSKFEVDNPSDRAKEGKAFAEQPSDKAISETRQHMLSDRVLDAAHYPVIKVRSVSVSGTPGKATLVSQITLHGISKNVTVPTHIEVKGQKLVADGEFRISQREFGVTPFTAAAGTLRVKDEVRVKFHLEADQARD